MLIDITLPLILIIGIISSLFTALFLSFFERSKLYTLRPSIIISICIYFALSVIVIINPSNLEITFKCFEIMSFTALFFILYKNRSSINQMIAGKYLFAHLFSGLLMLIYISSSNGRLFQYPNLNDLTPFGICLMISLLINIGMPPFNFWIVKAYSAMNFYLSIFVSAIITKVNLYFINEVFAGNIALLYCGMTMIVYSAINLLFAQNIRKFLMISIVGHNGLFLIGFYLSPHDQFTLDLFIISFATQILMFVLIYNFTHHQKSEYFIDLKMDLANSKLLFTLSVLVNAIFVGLPVLSPIYYHKAKILHNISGLYSNILTGATILLIFSHIFLWHKKLFRFFLPIGDRFLRVHKLVEYRRNLFFLTFYVTVTYYLYINFIHDIAGITVSVILEYVMILILCLCTILLTGKFFVSKQRSPKDFDYLFCIFRNLLKFIVLIIIKCKSNIYEYIDKFKRKNINNKIVSIANKRNLAIRVGDICGLIFIGCSIVFFFI